MLTNSQLIVDPKEASSNEDVRVLRCDYNIIFSASYEVPILYFNVYRQGMSLSWLLIKYSLLKFNQ